MDLKKDFKKHPCFNKKAAGRFGRVHLPVAPRCNIQCNFCNRKFDCVNESRPGVTSGILTPDQSMAYMETVTAHRDNIAVVGIAGPGDPFANPDETLEVLAKIREKYPKMLLCVATNGLNLLPHVSALSQLRTSHVTVTVNAVDPAVGERIYAWVRYGRKVYRAEDGARILLENQLAAILALKSAGMVVKINAIMIPGVNDHHIAAVARKMSELGADIFNCVPYYPNQGARFAHIPEPTSEQLAHARSAAEKYMPQMRHCKRCRADAVGLLGDKTDQALMDTLQECSRMPDAPADFPALEQAASPLAKPDRLAAASLEGVLINQHLGEAVALHVYENQQGRPVFLETRPTPPIGGGEKRWLDLSNTFADCRMILTSGAGKTPKAALSSLGIRVLEVEGLIQDVSAAIFRGENFNHLLKRDTTACGQACTGSGAGCG